MPCKRVLRAKIYETIRMRNSLDKNVTIVNLLCDNEVICEEK